MQLIDTFTYLGCKFLNHFSCEFRTGLLRGETDGLEVSVRLAGVVNDTFHGERRCCLVTCSFFVKVKVRYLKQAFW